MFCYLFLTTSNHLRFPWVLELCYQCGVQNVRERICKGSFVKVDGKWTTWVEYELLNSSVDIKPGIRGCLCTVLEVLVHPRQVLTTQLCSYPSLYFLFKIGSQWVLWTDLGLLSVCLISWVAVSIGPAQISLLLSTFSNLKSQECFLRL